MNSHALKAPACGLHFRGRIACLTVSQHSADCGSIAAFQSGYCSAPLSQKHLLHGTLHVRAACRCSLGIDLRKKFLYVSFVAISLGYLIQLILHLLGHRRGDGSVLILSRLEHRRSLRGVNELGQIRHLIIAVHQFRAVPRIPCQECQCSLLLQRLRRAEQRLCAAVYTAQIHFRPRGVQNLIQLKAVNLVVVRLPDDKFSRVVVSQSVIEAQVHGLSVGAGHVRVMLVDNAAHIGLRGCLRRIGHVRGAHDTQGAHRILLDIAGGLIHLPAHDGVADAGHSQIS